MAALNLYQTERFSWCSGCGIEIKPGEMLGRNGENGLPDFVCENCANFDGPLE